MPADSGIPCVTSPCYTATPGVGDFPGVTPAPSDATFPTLSHDIIDASNTAGATNKGDVSANTFAPVVSLPTVADFLKIHLPSATPTAPPANTGSSSDPCTTKMNWISWVWLIPQCQVSQLKNASNNVIQIAKVGAYIGAGLMLFIFLIFVLVVINLAENVTFRVNVSK